MRTFPKSLAGFREVIEERGSRPREMSIGDLKKLENSPVEKLTFDSRPATIATFVQSRPDGTVRVVVQGFMKARFVPGWHVALDGFYKQSDGRVTPMPDEEFNEFD